MFFVEMSFFGYVYMYLFGFWQYMSFSGSSSRTFLDLFQVMGFKFGQGDTINKHFLHVRQNCATTKPILDL